MDMNEIKAIFFQECEEGLAELETGLLALNDGDDDPETVNAVFRAVHSIKGGAGAFALDDLVSFAHVFETTLDCVRSNQLEPTRDVVKVLLKSADVLADLTNAARDGGSVDPARCQALIADLEALANGEVPSSEEPATAEVEQPAEPTKSDDEGEADFQPVPVAFDDLQEGDAEFEPVPFSFDDFGSGQPQDKNGFRIVFKPKPDLYLKGNETLLLLRELDQLGELEVTCDWSELPGIDALDPEGAYLTWTATLSTGEDEDAVRSVFEFAEWDCELEISPVAEPAPADTDAAMEQPEEIQTSVQEPASATETVADAAREDSGADAPAEPIEKLELPNVIEPDSKVIQT